MSQLVSFAVGVLTHFGLWKPTGVATKAADALITPRTRPMSQL